jgi:hypothetical protein
VITVPSDAEGPYGTLVLPLSTSEVVSTPSMSLVPQQMREKQLWIVSLELVPSNSHKGRTLLVI